MTLLERYFPTRGLFRAYFAACLIVAVVAVWAASRFSVWLAMAVAAASIVASVRLTHAVWPIKKRVRELDDAVLFKYCRAGSPVAGRKLYRALPSDPRCRLCLIPFRGVGRVLGVKPSRKNPNFCPT